MRAAVALECIVLPFMQRLLAKCRFADYASKDSVRVTRTSAVRTNNKYQMPNNNEDRDNSHKVHSTANMSQAPTLH